MGKKRNFMMVILIGLIFCFFIYCGKKEEEPQALEQTPAEEVPSETPETPEKPSVDGTFTMNGKTTPFKFVYVWEEKSLLDSSKQNLHFLFTDNSLPEGTDFKYGLTSLGREGKIHALEAAYSSDNGNIVGGKIYHEGTGNMNISFSQGNLESQIKILEDGTVEGEIFTEGPIDSFDNIWEVRVNFKTTLPNKEE